MQVVERVRSASEVSSRHALPEHTLCCSLSGKRILMDEVELSAVTGKPVARSLLKTWSAAMPQR
jgi:hypothetical protein